MTSDGVRPTYLSASVVCLSRSVLDNHFFEMVRYGASGIFHTFMGSGTCEFLEAVRNLASGNFHTLDSIRPK